jgi:mono/diheme cytochrome c family protein
MRILAPILCLPLLVASIQANESFMDAACRIRDTLLAERIRQDAAGKALADADVALGPWYRIGPFRDQGPLLNWMDNVDSSYKHVFEVEQETLGNGAQPVLDKEYPAPNFPMTPEAVRSWVPHPEWIDGYYQQFARGPAPSAGETQYVYREITTKGPVEVEIDCIIRAPESDRRMGQYGMEDWRRTGRYTWWVNGQEIVKWGGQGRSGNMPQKAKVQLNPGKNHFFAKFTNNRHAYGFAFSVYGRHPNLRHEVGFEQLWRPLAINKSTDLPYYREHPDVPEWFVKKAGWLESLVATRDSLLNKPGGANDLQAIWTVLYAAFDAPGARRQIALAERFCGKDTAEIFNRKGDALHEWIRSKFIAGASGIVPVPNSLKGNVSLREVITECTDLVYYQDSLQRLLAMRFHPEAMPGVEHAAVDSKGRIVPAIEKALEKYPTSAAGDRHAARLAKLESEVKPLLARMASTGEPMVEEVFAAAEMMDQMWDQTIGELPELLFLERPTYGYDSMMFVNAGTDQASIRVFNPQAKNVRTLVDRPGHAHEISLSWDGNTIYIGGGGKISAMDVDGRNHRTLQSGQSPCEMPDGRLVFFDFEDGRSPCKGNGLRQLLFICDPEGGNRKVVSANLTIDTSPSVMNNGRIIFTRWDYGVNKNVFNRHAIWEQNPDGTGLDLYFGNTVIDPRSMCRPRQIPGRPEVISVFGPHHAHLTGLVGLLWNVHGKEAADGLGFRRLTHDTASVGDRPPVHAYQDAQPLNEQLFLVSYGGRHDRKVGLYLLDRSGNKKCILETAGPAGVHSAQVFAPRPRPPIIRDRSQLADWTPHVDLFEQMLTDPDWSQKATMLLHDVYQGIEPEIERGRAAYLAVMEQVIQSGGRGGSMGVGTIWYANRVVGLVPIEKDGSAHFEVPALRSLYFHVLDKDGKMLMTQGSDFHAMPGEVRSCVGCHEQRKGIDTPPDSAMSPMAARKRAVRPRMPDWGTNGIIEYEVTVQPILDKYCTECHSGPNPKANLNLTGDRTTVYNMSYMELTDRMLVHFTPGTGSTHAQPTNDLDEQAPLSRGSLLSKLTKHIQDSECCNMKMSFEEQLAVFLWIDSNVPFYGHCRQRSPTLLEDRARQEMAAVHKRRCAGCHGNDNPDTKSGLNEHHTTVHVGEYRPGQWGVARSGMRVRHLNLSNPAHSAALQAPLAKGEGGWELCKEADGKPVFTSQDDPDYQQILASLKKVVHRPEPGVKELLAAGAE